MGQADEYENPGLGADLELTTGGDLIARIDGKEVARSAERKLALRWEMF